MRNKIKKLFKALDNWKSSIPLAENPYIYRDHPTIYTRTSGRFNPSEKQILTHRYANKYLKGEYVKFYIEDWQENYKDESVLVRDNCWTYALINSVCHQNSHRQSGYILIRYFCANTCELKELKIEQGTKITAEIITVTEFEKLLEILIIKS